MASQARGHEYHLVNPSPWPAVGAFAAFVLALGFLGYMHGMSFLYVVPGILGVLYTMLVWWRDVIHEAEVEGDHTPVVQIGLRYGMVLFIASEVMFFVAWFWAYFNASLYPTAAIGGHWPPAGIEVFDPWHLPFVNTLILLLSGTTVTWAHHALLEGNRRDLLRGLGLTVILGVLFTCCQAIEYSHAPFKFYGGGVYSSVFFLATGFHGFHVIVGTTFLAVCWFRAKANHFTPERHFGFEAAAWYWHFVDVVWLFLFACIYWYGAGQIAVE